MYLFNNGAKTSTINLARSALNFFLCYELDMKNDQTLFKLFKFFYKERPLQVRYMTYWPVQKLLECLSGMHPASDLSLKDLTIKTLALIALTSSDRGQTISFMNIVDVSFNEDSIDFIIFNRLKNTRRTHKPKIISCVSSDIDSLNVKNYVTEYMDRTLPLRLELLEKGFSESNSLFLSWATKRPVTKQTLTRWLKMALQSAGIDCKQFGAHSYRGASVSHAYNHGASLAQIVSHGSWKNVETFKRHYFAPEYDSSVGNIILNEFRG